MGNLTKVRDDFTPTMEKMLDRARSSQAGFSRIYAIYQRFQTERFMSENSSEGKRWSELSPVYREYKKKRYGGGPKRSGGNWRSWPGQGSKMGIGTGTMAGAVIGPGAPFEGTDHHRAMFKTNLMVIQVEEGGVNAEGFPFDYPSRFNEERPVMGFSKAHIQEMKDELKKFIFGY